jgi:WD40 repeat protein
MAGIPVFQNGSLLLSLRACTAGIELAALNGHPEEVYGLKFMKSPGSNAQQEQQQVASQGTGTNMLLAASGESLYLWDLQAGRMIAQTAPPPTAALAKLGIANNGNGSSSGLMASSEPRAVEAISTAAAAATSTPPHGSQDDSSQVKDAAEEGDRDDYDDFMPSYIFSLALADGTNWLAGSCSDGMLRMWDGSNSSLTEFAAVQVGRWSACLPCTACCRSLLHDETSSISFQVLLLPEAPDFMLACYISQ